MGSWRACYTLGWGGWWYWDPVENASFPPWLVGTALIHSSIVVERRDTLKSWTILLAIITFLLSLVGTFLVRSGVLSSVHAFAVDPARGMFILALLVVVIGGSLTLYAVRVPSLHGSGLFAPLSREGVLVLNNLLLTTGAATVLLETLYPLFLDAVGGPKLSVGFPCFDGTFVPLMVPLLLAVGVGRMLAWKRGDPLGALQRLWAAFGAAIVVILIGLTINDGGHVPAWLGLGLATWTFAAALLEFSDRLRLFRIPFAESRRRALNLPRTAYGMTFAHMGLAVSVAGISASAFVVEHLDVVKIGGALPIAGYLLHLDKVERQQGPNYTADDAGIRITKGDVLIATVHPERRFFSLQQQTTSETAIRTNFLADLYIALGDPDNEGGWTMRAYNKPLVPWIWMGAIIMAFGGVVSLSERRVGVAHRVRAAAAAQQAGN